MGSPLGGGNLDMDMQVSVGSPPGHGHSDIRHAGVSGQPPLDADSRTLDTQVSVDSPPPGCGHSVIGHTGVSGQPLLDADIRTSDTQVSVDSPPWTRTFGHWTHRCQWTAPLGRGHLDIGHAGVSGHIS